MTVNRVFQWFANGEIFITFDVALKIFAFFQIVFLHGNRGRRENYISVLVSNQHKVQIIFENAFLAHAYQFFEYLQVVIKPVFGQVFDKKMNLEQFGFDLGTQGVYGLFGTQPCCLLTVFQHCLLYCIHADPVSKKHQQKQSPR